ncbi:DUF4198 domain-containing protein [Rhodocyclus purpureus]|uniref:DUF4198 domain-containing protein n=1 Tax=Rhodocyclus purpureus TaxID=1067 RepID=UPI001914C33D|nr:DUF4198 domain-containing protein [Rhodocyclus purpureus]MBK5914764.1 hypothetical protein [Rhodocyclus purpureus]
MHFRLFLPLALFSLPVLAHDLWIEKDAGGYVLFQGHRHSAHEGAELVPYAASAVQAVSCVAADGSAKLLPPAKAYPARFAGDCASLLTTFSTGYWTKTVWETKNIARTGISGVIRSWYAEESLKYVERWGTGSAEPAGRGFEISATTNPFALRVGDKLVVQVSDSGKPVAGVPVAYAGDTRGATGPDGKVAIRLRRGGMQLITASLETPLADGKADVLLRTAALQFEIAR